MTARCFGTDMTASRIYLDYNASAPLLPQAREAMLAALEAPGNASSVHREGRAARHILDEARAAIAALCNAEAAHIVFTSGATEAANLLLTSDWRMGRAPLRLGRLIVGATAHPCMTAGGRFAPDSVRSIPVNGDGVLDVAALARLLAEGKGAAPDLVAIEWANNETGVIQPVAEIAAVAREAGAILVVDAVQAAGRVPIDISADSADFLILSSHKIGGPQGAGVIVARADLMMPEPFLKGGGQERGHRPGTENVAAIAGFGAAARAAAAALAEIGSRRELRDMAERALREMAPDALVHGKGAPRLANTLTFSLAGVRADTVQIALDLAGIAVSTGSACSSGKVGASPVLAAMGLGGDVSAVRVSLGAATDAAQIERLAAALKDFVTRRSAA